MENEISLQWSKSDLNPSCYAAKQDRKNPQLIKWEIYLWFCNNKQ